MSTVFTTDIHYNLSIYSNFCVLLTEKATITQPIPFHGTLQGKEVFPDSSLISMQVFCVQPTPENTIKKKGIKIPPKLIKNKQIKFYFTAPYPAIQSMQERVSRPVSNTTASVSLSSFSKLKTLSTKCTLVDFSFLCSTEWHPIVFQLLKQIQASVMYNKQQVASLCFQ